MKIHKEKAEEYLWGPAEWKKRTQFIAKLIPKGSAVVDLGGGLCHLYKYLEDPKYISIDVDGWTDQTVIADFNKGEYPDLHPQYNQYIVAQGVIEYMKKPKEFLREIHKYGDILILSYRRWTPDKWRMPRRKMSFDDISEYLKATKWEKLVEKNILADQGEAIEKVYICRKK